jgi:peptide deformylase
MPGIVQEPDVVLRKKASLVPKEMIGSAEIQSIINRMKDSLAGEDDGVAIAAPQIGESWRIFVISKKVSKKLEDDLVFINPEIIRFGKKKEELSEGCLSVRWKYGLVKRATTATVRALNTDGNEFVMNGRGLIAQIFQHETDHLDGILFIDKAKNIEDIPPQK